jgi:glycerophosphoryl diester phosphodiesterase
MSSDFRILRILNQDYPDIEGGLIFGRSISVRQIVDSLGFVPKKMHPFQDFVNAEMIKQAHAINSEVIPFTINQTKDMFDLIDLGVDGIITDYPDSARHLTMRRSR